MDPVYVDPLTNKEKEILREFVQLITVRYGPIPPAFAQKFLMARKWEPIRAANLYQNYIAVFSERNLLKVDPRSGPVFSQLLTGKFVIPGTYDRANAKVIIVRGERHVPDPTNAEAVLQALVFLLHHMTDSVSTQRTGITFVYDMSTMGWANLDSGLCKSLIDVLQNGFPARVRNAVFLNAPFWIRLIFGTFSPLLSTKLRNKVRLVSNLDDLIEPADLPTFLGGTLQYTDAMHQAFLDSILSGQPVERGRLGTAYTPAGPLRAAEPKPAPPPPAQEQARPPQVNAMPPKPEPSPPEPEDERPPTPPPRTSKPANLGIQLPEEEDSYDEESEVDEGRDSKLYRQEIPMKIDELRESGDMTADFVLLSNESSTEYSYNAALSGFNQNKNRYSNVLPYDYTRVILPSSDPYGGYINANYIDGYDRPKAYIATQGPLPNTFADFWEMVWHEASSVVVMPTGEMEGGRLKCHRYWPELNAKISFGDLDVKSIDVQEQKGVIYRLFELSDPSQGASRLIHHYQFTAWPDHGVPGSANIVLGILDRVNKHQEETQHKGPVVIHCSAGIGRTGTFITIDLNIKSLEAENSIDILNTIRKLRRQRAGMVQTPGQYDFCYQAILEYMFTNETES